MRGGSGGGGEASCCSMLVFFDLSPFPQPISLCVSLSPYYPPSSHVSVSTNPNGLCAACCCYPLFMVVVIVFVFVCW
jgi:hypothetical protein